MAIDYESISFLGERKKSPPQYWLTEEYVVVYTNTDIYIQIKYKYL